MIIEEKMDTQMIKSFCEKHFDKYFVGVYPIDHIYLSVKCRVLARCLCKNYRFIILNSDSSDEGGTHWLFLMKLDGNNIFMFDSFGLLSLEYLFDFQDDKSYDGPKNYSKDLLSYYHYTLRNNSFQKEI